MLEAVWFAVNVLVGVPLAVGSLVLCREVVRALLALALGFRVFEFKWGAGRRLWARPIGPIDWVLGAVPIVASIIAESGSPKNHRIARMAQACGPMTAQIVFLFLHREGSPGLSDTILAGLAPSAALQVANILLLGLHGLIPFETRTGFRSDIRLILDLGFAGSDADRHARASYYARYARHWLERAEVERAEAILEQGLTQLGRDPLLVACQARLLAEDLSSVVDQVECADALRTLVKEAEPERRRDRASWSRRERIRQAAITALPLSLALLGTIALESERLARSVHDRLAVASGRIADGSRVAACEEQLERWARWIPPLDLVLGRDSEALRDRHDQLARLEQCRGRLKEALAHQALAIAAAERVRADYAERVDAQPGPWFANEVRLAMILRHVAELETQQSRYRLALAAVSRAEGQLDRVKTQLRTWSETDAQAGAHASLESEKSRLGIARDEILTRMGAR